MVLNLIMYLFADIKLLFITKKRKGEVDALMIALAGVLILAILALVFVMTVGTSLDTGVDMLCKYKSEKTISVEGAKTVLSKLLGVC